MTQEKLSREAFEKKVNIHAWKDAAFREKLLSNPKEALKEFGMQNIPQPVQISCLEESENHWTIVLRTPPPNSKNLSEKELEKYAAGSCTLSVSFRE